MAIVKNTDGTEKRAPGKFPQGQGTNAVSQQRVNAEAKKNPNAQFNIPAKEDLKAPQVKLHQNPYNFDTVSFPSNLGDWAQNTQYAQWVKFTPLVQSGSQWAISRANDLSGSAAIDAAAGIGARSLADTNTIGKVNNVTPFTPGQAATVGGEYAGLRAGQAVIQGSSGAFNASDDQDMLTAKVQTVLNVGKGLLVGAGLAVGLGNMNLSRKTSRAGACICLYMPDTVDTKLSYEYEGVKLTEALGAAGIAQVAGGSIKNVFAQMFGNGAGIGAGLGSAGFREIGGKLLEASKAVGTGFTDLLLFSGGVAQNPQVELLFKNIQNREFVFDFKLSPKSADEALNIQKIIKHFRFFSAPEVLADDNTSFSGRYFIPPSEFEIEFMIGNSPNDKIPKISTCVLTGIDVNYGSSGQWSTFEDGMPVEVSIQLRFKEVEIMHKKLIDEGY